MGLFLKEVQDLTLKTNLGRAQARVDETIKYCKTQVKIAAGSGEYKVEIPLDNIQASKDDFSAIISYFLNEGFKCELVKVKQGEDSAIGYSMVACININW